MENAKTKASFVSQIRSFPSNFWCACFMETLERLAFFGSRAVAPLYLVASAGQNGLGLDYRQKGIIFSIWAIIQCLLPMVSGGYSDRYGYRKSLAVAFVLNIIGYCGMAQSKPIADYLAGQGWENPGFWVFLAAACIVASGTAIFKPPTQGTIAKSTNEETSSMGWGLFYWVVNIGGAVAPMAAAVLRVEIDWHRVFYAAAIVTAANFLPAFLFFKEPEKVKPAGDEGQPKGAVDVFVHSFSTIFKDLRLIVFLGIFSCFWLMFMQLWDLLPNFIDEWVDTSDISGYFAWFSQSWVLGSGQVKPEMIINIDAIAIILLVIPLSWLIGKISKVAAMIIGMLISLAAFVATGSTMIGWVCCLAVFVFAIGEMACSPTFSAYVGLIAPKDKKALYMGYSNIPFAVGWGIGNFVGGFIYQQVGSKFDLARRFLVNNLGITGELALDDEKLPKEQVMQTMAHVMEEADGPAIQRSIMNWWNAVEGQDIPKEQLTERVNEAFTEILGTVEPAALKQATQVLWDLHHPWVVWYYLGAIGLAGTIGMIVFYYATRKPAAQGQEAPA